MTRHNDCMPVFRVDITYERIVSFYVDAENKLSVVEFMNKNSELQPGDVPGLIDEVSNEVELDCHVSQESKITSGFYIDENLVLREKN